MNISRYLPILFLAAAPLVAHAQSGFPFQSETLKYTLNWPSGLSLGDATMTATKSESGWTFNATVDAAVPGFTVADKYHSTTGTDLCSNELTRDITHGKLHNREETTFDQKKGTAKRSTTLPEGGGITDFDIPTCARDALAFVYYARFELGQGRVPPAQKVFLGSAYDVHIEYTGAMNIRTGDKQAVTDHTVVSVKGPKSDFQFEIFFGRDPARTPLAVKIPLPLGTLSLELVR